MKHYLTVHVLEHPADPLLLKPPVPGATLQNWRMTDMAWQKAGQMSCSWERVVIVVHWSAA